jgi:SpoVK/Ycf46/Vps4 family AAA+-type ATPase
MSGANWIEANQRLLVAEFGRLKARLAGEDGTVAEQALASAREAMPSPAAIDVLVDAFGLSAFERDILLLCAGAEMDGALAALCQDANETTRQPGVTFGLALARLADPHWSALAPIRPLRMWRLVELRDERAMSMSRLSIDERVLHFLAGVNFLDARLRPLLRLLDAANPLVDSHSSIVEQALHALNADHYESCVVQLIGDDPSAQSEIARRVADELGLHLYSIRGADLPASAHEADAFATLWYRESQLLRSTLLVEVDGVETDAVRAFLSRIEGLVFYAARQSVALDRPQLRLAVERPSGIEQKQLWIEVLGDSAHALNGSLDAVVAQFRLSTSAIVRTASQLSADASAPSRLELDLWRACRESARGRLDDLAQRVEPVATWDDLVLPAPQLATLREVAAHVRNRLRVYEEWGFASKSRRGLGINVLFAGESGTGKTMAAEVLANELRLDLYRIDLAAMVSKYIGETEKNLRRVFDAAEDSGAILLFDEADALFGKRSEVKDSHDRYANIEVSYLLQRMEAYRGLAILTTNMKHALDAAFQRRLRFVVQFPFPDAELRERIWRGVFPTDTPLATVDHRRLAQLNIAGASIRNIAMNAAFLAAEAGSPVAMPHLLQAARSEAAKRERALSDAETRGWT